jgi:uncharacterized membrane protein
MDNKFTGKKEIIDMKKFTVFDAAALLVWLLPLVYIACIYASLPASVPVHYDIKGAADRYGSKTEFAGTSVFMNVVAAGVYLLLKFLPNIDPKKAVRYGEATFQKLAVGLVIFVTALNLGIIYAAAHRGFEINRFILPLIGLLFAFIGNMMNNIKPNYFAGFRTPWALENGDNWRATHRLAGPLWFGGGLLITASTLFLPPTAGAGVMACVVVIITFVPYIYSYRFFKKQKASNAS